MPIKNNSFENTGPVLKVWRAQDEICFGKLKSGDCETFKNLYRLYASALYGAIIRDVKNEKLSNELLEATFTYAWHNISAFDESKSKIFIWLLKTSKDLSNKNF
ncbi:hypothetical protein [Pedobacter aquatilis]|uniref:hypothetical protein n=1 Tax=Pedobacter aquatilis TaxID=351343 RepID=UPI00292E658C|nr:hypothetical protein [Pedobacter aquatilis]